MRGRILHLFLRELHSHRWILTAFVVLQLIVAASCIGVVQISLHYDAAELMNPSSWIQEWTNWIWRVSYMSDLWIGIIAGLVAAWIALADPLQSPMAFWPTRPARLGEVVLAKALVCLSVLVLFPAACGMLAAWLADFSARDILLSGATFVVVKVGWVPVGFVLGLLLPAPGRRFSALLVLLGSWLGLATWTWIKVQAEPDYRDQSLSFATMWLLSIAALPLLLRWRRSPWTQVALALLAFAVPWIVGPTRKTLEHLPKLSAEALGMPSSQAIASPANYTFSEEHEAGEPKEATVEMRINRVPGLPAGVVARAVAVKFVVETGPGHPVLRHSWTGKAMVMQTWYEALAHVVGVPLERFPTDWRLDTEYPELVLPHKTFVEWSDDQVLTVSGTVTLRLYHVTKQWEGIAPGERSWLKDCPRLHGAYLPMNTGPDYFDVDPVRPQIADCWAANDLSPQCGVFNDHFAAWNIVFQPPVKGPDGKFSNEARRDPPLWAVCENNGENHDNMEWLRHMRCSLNLTHSSAPELRQLLRNKIGMQGLPIILVTRVAYAEVEVPLAPARFTKQQILETRPITLAKP